MKVYILDSSYYGELKVFKSKEKAEKEFDHCRSMVDEDIYEVDEDRYNYFTAYSEEEDEAEYASLEEYEVVE